MVSPPILSMFSYCKFWDVEKPHQQFCVYFGTRLWENILDEMQHFQYLLAILASELQYETKAWTSVTSLLIQYILFK